jgi:hypothetical protein
MENIETLLEYEREVISYIKAHWLYEAARHGRNFIKMADIVLDDTNNSMIRTRVYPFSIEFPKYIPGYGDFVDHNKGYRTQVVKFDDINYIKNHLDQIIGGVVLREQQVFGLFEVMNFFSASCKGTWCLHNKVFHFSDKDDSAIYRMVKYEALNETA